MENLPQKISPDAIVEALVEFRFVTKEMPEIVMGRLIDAKLWEGFAQKRLPTADIPQPIRMNDPSFRFQPLFELQKMEANRLVKIGPDVLSFHVTGSYPGWSTLRMEIERVIEVLLEKVKIVEFSRVGLRYINVFYPNDHFIQSLADTSISFAVADSELTSPVAISYNRFLGECVVLTRVATPEFVIGALRPGFSMICDIDVFTTEGLALKTREEVMPWIEKAHTAEKQEFFTILPQQIVQKLTGGEA
jgi:uncharacterized protein (TIGR04255 family)